MAGPPFGNQNAVKNRPYRAAIERALKKRTLASQRDALDEIAEKVIEDALSDIPQLRLDARKELADRLEGKPTQTIAGDSEQPLSVTATVNFIKPNDP